ncbi:MAG: TonB-dependent receptor [Pseudomonadota bacterium]
MAIALALAAWPQIGLAQATQEIDVPAQPLPAALAELSAETGLQVLAPTELVAGRTSPSVQGTMTPRAALDAMLSGSGLVVRTTGSGSLIIEAAEPSQIEGGIFLADEIVVTGERTARTIQDTASSVAVRTGEDLERQADSADLRALYNRIPNVNGTGLAGGVMPTVRGVKSEGQQGFFGALFSGGLPRVTIQVDGRPQSLGELQSGDVPLWDVEQVELFRGPQTTTQGQNAIGGAIFVNTKDPIFGFEAEARVLGGNFATYQGSLVLNTQLIENELALRVSVDGRTHRSFVDVIGTTQSDINADPEKDDHRNARVKLLFEPEAAPGLSLKATFANTYTSRLFRERVDNPPSTISTNLTNSVFQNETNALTFDADYEFTDVFQIRNTISFSDVKSDFVIPPIIGNGPASDDRKQLNFETVGEFDNPDLGISARLGFSLDYAMSDGFVDARPAARALLFEGEDLSYGVFGEATWSPTDWVDLTVGGRFQKDTASRDITTVSPALPVVAINRTEDIDSSAFLPRASVSFHPADNVTIGALVARGYNPGGSSLAFTPPFAFVEFDPEFVWNYELFWRSSWFDNKLSFNGNVFFADYRDQQVTLLEDTVGGLASIVVNADKTRSYGVEMDFGFRPRSDLEFIGSLGFLKTDFVDAETPFASLTGLEFARAPSVTASLAMNYEPIDNLTLGIEGNYTGDYFSDAANTPLGKIDSRFVANAKVAYEYGNVTVFGAVTNLFDNTYLLDRFTTGATLGDPLEFELGLHIRF